MIGRMAQTNSAPDAQSKETAQSIQLVSLGYNRADQKMQFDVNVWAGAVLLLIALLLALWRARAWRHYKSLEIDEAEIGIGPGKVKLRPNLTDRQVAYQIWVELSTRKIGLPIDLDHDVIAEVYDSWHTFFGVTRDLIKSVPVSRVADPSTRKIINLSIEVLNEGLRPHLTRWQARFRNWFGQQQPQAGVIGDEPQKIQKIFPEYAALETDLLAVNKRLMAYRKAMHSLVYGA